MTATIALVAALSGGAYAATKVGPKDIKPDAVRSKHIKKGQVRTADIRKNAVKNMKIADGGVIGNDLANGIVTAEKADIESLSGAFGSGILGTVVGHGNAPANLPALAEGGAIGGGDAFNLVVPVNAQVSDLVARADSPVGAQRTALVRIVKRGTAQPAISCTIPSGGETCTESGPSASFAAGDRLGVEVSYAPVGGVAGAEGVQRKYEVGYRLIPAS